MASVAVFALIYFTYRNRYMLSANFNLRKRKKITQDQIKCAEVLGGEETWYSCSLLFWNFLVYFLTQYVFSIPEWLFIHEVYIDDKKSPLVSKNNKQSTLSWHWSLLGERFLAREKILFSDCTRNSMCWYLW